MVHLCKDIIWCLHYYISENIQDFFKLLYIKHRYSYQGQKNDNNKIIVCLPSHAGQSDFHIYTSRLPGFRDYLVFVISQLSQNLNFVAVLILENKETLQGNYYYNNPCPPQKKNRPGIPSIRTQQTITSWIFVATQHWVWLSHMWPKTPEKKKKPSCRELAPPPQKKTFINQSWPKHDSPTDFEPCAS